MDVLNEQQIYKREIAEERIALNYQDLFSFI